MNYNSLTDQELKYALDRLYRSLEGMLPACRPHVIGEIEAARHEVYKRAHPLDYPEAAHA